MRWYFYIQIAFTNIMVAEYPVKAWPDPPLIGIMVFVRLFLGMTELLSPVSLIFFMLKASLETTKPEKIGGLKFPFYFE
jgi:hypothetical protein